MTSQEFKQLSPSNSFLAKSILIFLGLAACAFLINVYTLQIIKEQSLLTPNLNTLQIVAGLMATACVFYTLSVGAWRNHEQYFIVPLPIALGTFLNLMQLDFFYAGTVFLAVFFVLCYDVYYAKSIKDQLVEINAYLVLRSGIKGLLYTFVFLSSVTYALYAYTLPVQEDVIDKVANLVEEQIQTVVLQKYSGGVFDYFGITESINGQVSQTIEQVLAPYRKFSNAVSAVLIFGWFQIIMWTVNFGFNFLVNPLFFILKRVHWVKTYKVMVEKEEVGF